jgi:AraC-like DNA-binding protein
MRVRLSTARHLLAYEDLSIARIAERCGFSSQPRFSTAFRRETGVPPSTWRRTRGAR